MSLRSRTEAGEFREVSATLSQRQARSIAKHTGQRP